MFTCLYSIWDWLEAPPVFTANMESKKLQQLQQANSHLAPQKKIPLAYQTTVGDYRTTTHSPVFQQNLLQYHQSNMNIPSYQSPTSSGGSQMTPVDIQPHTHMLLKSTTQGQYQQQQYGSIGGEQLYQSPTNERSYQMAGRNHYQSPLSPLGGGHQHSHPVNALQAQYQQLQQAKMQAQIQTQNEAIVQQQRTFAMRQQLNPPVPQSHFHMSQSSSMMSSPIQNQQQQHQQQQQYQQQLQQHQQTQQLQSQTQLQSNAHHRIAAPPSTLNLSSQFQPAQGPLKINNNNEARVHQQLQQNQHQQQQQQQQHYQDALNQSIYQQHQQLPQKQQHTQQQSKYQSSKVDTSVNSGLTGGLNEPSPVYIQQNHPGHVVNQACQTQISGAAGNKTKTPSSEESSSGKSPGHESSSPSHHQLDRKKSSGSVQALKLPFTKRPPSSPVTISGWLYKQGSEGLKVWRKRWFVLSEYCLYYYKGPEEEKVLGAILLPSYRISACLPEDKIYRKFAFKCEHTNMRTYWLAAENGETMIQWVKALTAAAMMQASSESSDQTSQPSVSSLNHSGENSDSGIHTFHSQQGKMGVSGTTQGPVTPASDNGAQPLYANAPPKPRRINDGGYSSPSPENSIERGEKISSEKQQILSQQQLARRSGGVMSPTLQQMQRSQQHAIYDTQTGNVTSTVRTNDTLAGQFHQMSLDSQKKSPYYMTEYGKHAAAYNQALELEEQLIRSQSQRLSEELYGERELYMQKIIQQRYPNQIAHGGVMTYPNAERRTPDAYGRSKNKSFADYEDIYNVAQQSKLAQAQQPTSAELGAYRRPMSPPTYDSTKHVPPMPSRYTPNHLEPSPSHVSLRSRPSVASISRPHSADFLEYEARAEAAAAAAIKPDPIRAPRPKSSLDINRTPDSYYYSEASYAEKMRQSALYLQKPQSQQPQQQQPTTPSSGGGSGSGSFNRSHDNVPYSNGTNNGMNTIGYENPYERIHKRHELLTETLNHGAQSVPRMSRSTTNTSIQSGNGGGNNIPLTKDYHHRSQYMQPNEQFLRSASARLPKRDDDTNTISISNTIGSPSNTIDGERKREESMKRLLEWKQRMLQSPLTRKGIQQPGSASVMAKLGSNPNILIGNNSGIQRSRSETHANSGTGYTSYSSDDEASISVRNVRNLPKVNLTVKPDPSDPINFEHNGEKLYYGTSTNIDPKFAAISTPTDRNYYSSSNGRDIHSSNYDINQSYRDRDNYYPLRKSGSRAEIDLLERETSSQIRNLDMSAGDLLSRTHEELVLLLIQLRRQNSQTARAIEQCCTDIHEVQNRIRTTDGLTRAESIQRLDYLKQHLLDLEKQYEKSKPLVNLVDNMVKLGSLYRSNENTSRQMIQPQRPESVTLDRLEFNQRMQERRMLQEEQKQWDRLSPNHNELQSKVRQLYHLDQLLQEESGTLQNLQKDKEDLERALGGLRARLQNTTGPPLALEAAKKQQHILERELSRVHQLLAENSKKLEQTVAGNARLEQELLVLRQKLQATKGSRGSQGALGSSQGGNDSIQYASTTTALLESELKRVQELVGDMQRQRQELSSAVKQLTENSNRLYQEIGSKENGATTSPSHIKKRNQSACWIETDLDSMVCVDRTVYDNSNLSTPLYVDTSSNNSSANPLNCSTSSKLSESDGKSIRTYRYPDSDGPETSGMESDEFLETNPFANLTNQEKQEIKTVRIVKRESERRHRDRERNTTNTSCLNLDHVQEEEIQDDLFSRSKSLPRTYNDLYENNYNSLSTSKDVVKTAIPQSSLSLNSSQPSSAKYTDYYGSVSSNGINNPYPVSLTDKNSNYSSYGQTNYQGKPIKNGIVSSVTNTSSTNRHQLSHQQQQQQQQRTQQHHQPQSYALRAKTESMQSLTKSISDLTPVFHSEAARQIISEMSAGSASEDNNTEKVPASHKHKRAIPREKRRHYTAPNNVNKTAMETVQTENDMNRNNTNWRARDDLDMEVALRPRINAPDVVRSALGHGEKISENTIDKLFGAPSKIVIPERYIPEKTPELSPEEKKRRQEKVEAIKKMLADAPMNSSNDTESLPPSKINAEKKQREHLLQLNQILAQQVMQMSKIVAENAMAALPSKSNELNLRSPSEEDRSSSPTDSLPLYQQRDNFFT